VKLELEEELSQEKREEFLKVLTEIVNSKKPFIIIGTVIEKDKEEAGNFMMSQTSKALNFSNVRLLYQLFRYLLIKIPYARLPIFDALRDEETETVKETMDEYNSKKYGN